MEAKQAREERGALVLWETVEGAGECGLEGLSEIAAALMMLQMAQNSKKTALQPADETTETKENSGGDGVIRILSLSLSLSGMNLLPQEVGIRGCSAIQVNYLGNLTS